MDDASEPFENFWARVNVVADDVKYDRRGIFKRNHYTPAKGQYVNSGIYVDRSNEIEPTIEEKNQYWEARNKK